MQMQMMKDALNADNFLEFKQIQENAIREIDDIIDCNKLFDATHNPWKDAIKKHKLYEEVWRAVSDNYLYEFKVMFNNPNINDGNHVWSKHESIYDAWHEAGKTQKESNWQNISL